MKMALFAAASFALLSTLCSSKADDQATLNIDDYKVTFEDEFNSLSISEWGPNTTWIAHTPWNGDFGDAKFVKPVEGFPFTTKDGILSIEMRKNPDGKWQSGLIASVDRRGMGFSQQYGYFEMRAKFPAGEGVWPAFWLIGVERLAANSTSTSEIDIVEHYGHAPHQYSSSVHVWPRSKDVKKFSETKHIPVEPGSLYNGYHLYGVLIDEDKTRFYFDRNLVWEIDTRDEHKQPMFLLVNLGLGAGWPIANAPSPSIMTVDYVRAYARR
jgi:beta-glucanase (GH16 family)